jgi:Protein of unknown function (DUF1203)
MNYELNAHVPADDDIEQELIRVLQGPNVSHVHARTALPQCYLYNVALVGAGASRSTG